MVLRNDPKMALDWLGLALDLLGLAQIGQLTNFCFCEKLTSDRHRIGMDRPGIGTGFVKIGIDWQGLGPAPIPCQSMTSEMARIGSDWSQLANWPSWVGMKN